MDVTLLWRYLLEHYIYWVYGQMNRPLEMDNANDGKKIFMFHKDTLQMVWIMLWKNLEDMYYKWNLQCLKFI